MPVDLEEMGPRLLTAAEFARKAPKPTREEIERARREREKKADNNEAKP